MEVIRDIQERVEQAAGGFTLSTENLLQQGFNLLRRNTGIFMLYSLAGIPVLSNPLSGIFLGGPFIAGYLVGAKESRDGRQLRFRHLARVLDKLPQLALLQLLTGTVILLGTILFIIPGIYFATSYVFAHFFTWFYDLPPTEATRLSRQMVSGNFRQIFILCLVLTGINIGGAMAFGIGLLLTVPFSFCVLFAAFDDIIGVPVQT